MPLARANKTTSTAPRSLAEQQQHKTKVNRTPLSRSLRATDHSKKNTIERRLPIQNPKLPPLPAQQQQRTAKTNQNAAPPLNKKTHRTPRPLPKKKSNRTLLPRPTTTTNNKNKQKAAQPLIKNNTSFKKTTQSSAAPPSKNTHQTAPRSLPNNNNGL